MRPLMEKMNITSYLKPSCGWSEGVRSVLRKHGLEWEEKDVVNNPEHHAEMIERSGQMMQPCVEINGHMLADVSGDEVEAWMLANNVVEPTKTPRRTHPLINLAPMRCRKSSPCSSKTELLAGGNLVHHSVCGC